MKLSLSELSTLPREQFYVLSNGKLVDDWSTLKENNNFQVHLRVLGGKGGFGSLLRSFGSQFYKSTNQDMCRDLSGRRLKDVKEEEKLKKYISKAGQREKEKQQKLDDKYKKLKQLDERKHEFNDTEYSRQRERILEETEDALQQGLKALEDDSIPKLSSDEAGPSGVTSKVLGKRKRTSDDEATSSSDSASASASGLASARKDVESGSKPKKAKKPMAGNLWLGIEGLNESDLDSDESDTEEKSEDGETGVVVEKAIATIKVKETKKVTTV